MIAYLAGPMTGYPRWNFDAFDEAAAKLRRRGFTVLSPAEMDRANGFNPDAPVEDYTLEDRQKALRADLNAVIRVAEAVVYLPGSEDSTGANLEMSVALAIGKPVVPLAYALLKGTSL
ncbi:nucleoside deoxyribosyltransferase [Arthrobacter phage BaileyBlu]|uniref:Nucleoside deoxyribosyltransferase n=1 Tax=Arthrobacter phage BaileyBlu TaxID=2910754 RepID=A0AA49GZE5_9CAUD|nr:MazG-like pyrophosphatase [Arthrobacter phage BaileyBlu]UJQ87166.1 nucleoside deoxyribosyltransferase [Arthrobacter phage BaileyBlu]